MFLRRLPRVAPGAAAQCPEGEQEQSPVQNCPSGAVWRIQRRAAGEGGRAGGAGRMGVRRAGGRGTEGKRGPWAEDRERQVTSDLSCLNTFQRPAHLRA